MLSQSSYPRLRLFLRVRRFFPHPQSLNNPGMNLPILINSISKDFNGFLTVDIFLLPL